MDGNQRFEAREDYRVVKGTCLVLTSVGELFYAGPIKASPDDITGMILVLSPADFALLRRHSELN